MALFDDEDLLYHYTSAPIAVESILRTGELRLGQFAFTNDPRESRSWYMSESLPDGYDLETERFMELSKDADGMLRRSVKLACFTQDDSPRNDRGEVSSRGFAHSSLWSHYGGGHSGVCIGIRRDLLPHLKSQLSQLGSYFDGPVSYVDDASPPRQATHVDLGQVEEFGLDAVLAVRIRENWKELFFTKDLDWVTEREFRCVVLSPDPEPIYIDVSDHIRCAILGDAFPDHQVATVHHAVERLGDVQVATITYSTGRAILVPSLPSRAEPTWRDHRRAGSVEERAGALIEAETETRDAQDEHSSTMAPALDPLLRSVKKAERQWLPVTDAEVSVSTRSSTAVPPAERQPAPGVPTEILQSEGAQCVVASRLERGFTLSLAVAAQLLKDKRIRLYALIAIESRNPEGIDRQEPWRAAIEAGKEEDPASSAEILADELDHQWADAVAAFDESRQLSVPHPD